MRAWMVLRTLAKSRQRPKRATKELKSKEQVKASKSQKSLGRFSIMPIIKRFNEHSQSNGHKCRVTRITRKYPSMLQKTM